MRKEQWLSPVNTSCTGSRHCTKPNVGAGLLAKAVCQIHSVTDTPPSRASPLPQFDLLGP
ncbi:hypothetical protein EJ576_05585 [Pseudomonas sp. C 49-2]|nr:hypothetical protein EJ576_05585 [Pseudomonas sp. C 49-2]